MSKSTQVSVPAPAPIIVPINPPREPDGPQMVEKGTLDVVRDTTLARISANGAHVLTQMAIRHAAAQEEADSGHQPGWRPVAGRPRRTVHGPI
ncbi:hypothetical protein G5V59_12970 [Nocardioides sp. W3-2-3]|uniref:hypothetical protein n=1 Tax=Nocardioides convexus TaxID=2712224 RepID=UPI002418B25D|nr:hypothetical protein [Nocardioides convexus]NHA00626.1 hypothetical protein [Nocardioides convexus]